MSNHKYFYLGPFLKCVFHSNPVERRVQGCPNCNIETIYDFCPRCGKRSDTILVPAMLLSVRDYTDSGVEEDTFNNLVSDGNRVLEHWLAPNGGDTPRNFGDIGDDDGEAGIVFDEPPDAEGEKRWMSEKYAADIVKLKSVYDSVEMKWGLVTYWC